MLKNTCIAVMRPATLADFKMLSDCDDSCRLCPALLNIPRYKC